MCENNTKGQTVDFVLSETGLDSPEEILTYVYNALEAKGHDPVAQIVGYLVSGDPTYITNYKKARSVVKRVERDSLLELVVHDYLVRHEGMKE